jgi:excisionase family DNA binding protein
MSDVTPINQNVNQEAQMPFKRNGASYYSVTEAAEALGVHRNTVIYWINSNQLKAKKQGIADKSPYMIPSEEVERAKEEMSKAVDVG